MRLLLSIAAALMLVPVAQAENVATPKMVTVASWAAGKPIDVWCEGNSDDWNRMSIAAGFTSAPAGYTTISKPRIFLSPETCVLLSSPRNYQFGAGLNVLLHEASHQLLATTDEALAECGARVLIYETLRRFYGVPFFSPAMYRVTASALAYSRAKPLAYQDGC